MPQTLLMLCLPIVAFGCQANHRVDRDDERELAGLERPHLVPKNWVGEPLPNGEGYRWSDPRDRGNAVRIHRGHPEAANPVDRDTYVVVTVHGQLLDSKGQYTGKYLRD